MEHQQLLNKNGKLLSANRVHIVHGLLISSLELALTLKNTISNKSHKLESLNNLIFFGSTAMELISFIFSLYTAIHFYNMHNNDEYEELVSIGVPIMSLGENAFQRKNEDNEIWSDSAYLGLVLQSISFFLCINYAFILYIDSIGSFDTKILFFIVCFILIFGIASYRAMFGNSGFFLLLLFSIPFIVEIMESIILFSTEYNFDSYILAFIDIIVIIPSSVVVVSHIRNNRNVNAISSLWDVLF